MNEYIFLLFFLSFLIILLFLFKKYSFNKDFLEQIKILTQTQSEIKRILTQQDAFKEDLHRVSLQVKELQSGLKEDSFKLKEELLKDLLKTQKIIENFKTVFEEREKKKEEIEELTKKIYESLIGARKRGLAGENILKEAFSQLKTADLIEYDFKVKGKTVEYALILPNKKRIAIDSKWPAYELLERLNSETDNESKEEILRKIEENVIKKVKEAAQYIDPALTANQVIVALPDSVYFLCKKAHLEAQKQNVLLIPYSLGTPFVLALYKLYLENAYSIDLVDLRSYLQKMESDLKLLLEILENRLVKSKVMLENVCSDYRNILGEMLRNIQYLKKISLKDEDKDKSYS